MNLEHFLDRGFLTRKIRSKNVSFEPYFKCSIKNYNYFSSVTIQWQKKSFKSN